MSQSLEYVTAVFDTTPVFPFPKMHVRIFAVMVNGVTSGK